MEYFKLSVDLDFPAIILIVLLLLGLYVLWRTQKSNTLFDFADMLRDDANKPSSARMAVFVCLAISSWAIMYILMKNGGKIDPWIFFAYVGSWSGAKVAEKYLEAQANRNPAKPGA